VRRDVRIIATATNTNAAFAAIMATTTIPIIFLVGTDPVEAGLVPSLGQPGGNITGVTVVSRDLAQKRLEVLHELVPAAKTIGLLVNPDNAIATVEVRKLQDKAPALGLHVNLQEARNEREIDAAFETWFRLKVGGVVSGSEALYSSQQQRIAALALRYEIPTIHQYRAFVTAGGLISYGGDNLDGWRLSGAYVGRILKGEKPANLPVQQSTKIELAINLKTARALGLRVPPTLLARADEVIE
jgi:putative tryptophan/tyrosine transport system substrate-binding protein